MGKDIQVSKPVNANSTPKEVYEFAPIDRKGGKQIQGVQKLNHLLFVKEDDGKVWKTEGERNQIFATIWSKEQQLTNRSVVRIHDFSNNMYTYSYCDVDGTRVHKTVNKAEVENYQTVDSSIPQKNSLTGEFKNDEDCFKNDIAKNNMAIREKNADAVIDNKIRKQKGMALIPVDESGIQIRTYYKVHDLSLRQFEQVQISNAVVEFLKSALEILATPFMWLYQMIAGAGDPRAFADMLGPVQHDRVGEINHDAVLSQLKFMGKFLSKEDTSIHHKDMELEGGDKDISFMGSYRTFKETKTHYQIWVDDKGLEITFDKSDPLQNEFIKRAEDNIKIESEYVLKDGMAFDQNHKLIQKLVAKKGAPYQRKDGSRYDYDKDYNYIQIPTVKVSFKSEWVSIPKDHDLVKHADIKTQDSQLNEKEAQPEIMSAVQCASAAFYQAYELGTEMREAINLGGKKRADVVVEKMARALENLTTEHPVILPMAQGEGGDYLPHFLVFTKNKYNIVHAKHICFSSTSLESRKMQVMTQYNVSNSLTSPEARKKFARALFSTQSVALAKDKKEAKIKGPSRQDKSLSSLLLRYGTLVITDSAEKKASRDPVKALFEIASQLDITFTYGITKSKWGHYDAKDLIETKENPHLSQDEHRFEEITSSKAYFYQVYVNHLISYYEENEGRLNNDERARSLDGILAYAKKVRQYVEKEVDLDTAKAVSDSLIEFVENKLEELGRREDLEQKDIDNLKNKVSIFSTTLERDIEEVIKRPVTVKDVENSRVSIEEWAGVGDLRIRMENAEGYAAIDERKEIEKLFLTLLESAQNYLRQKNADPLAAKSLLLGMMQSLPPADDATFDKLTFWDSLTEAELTRWGKNLDSLAERMMEASLRSGTYPLKPHEVFEFNVVMPLIQRHMFSRLIPMKLTPLTGTEGIFNTYKNSPEKIRALETQRDAFIAMRDQEIEERETKRLKDEWEKADARHKEEQERYDADLKLYNQQLADYEKYRNEPFEISRKYPYPRHKPDDPKIPSDKEKKETREAQLERDIADAKRNDDFRGNLTLRINVKTLDRDWDRLVRGISCHDEAGERTHAVLGRYAKIMGVSKELYAYKLGGTDWIGKTFCNTQRAIWLMDQDCSVLVGSSPEFEKRYAACKRCFDKHAGNSANIDDKHAKNFMLGYDELGDGTQFKPQLFGQDEKKLLSQRIDYQFKGQFTPGDGGERLVPDAFAYIARLDAMRKIMRDPVRHMKPYRSGSYAKAAWEFMTEQKMTNEAVRNTFAAMPAIYLVAAPTVRGILDKDEYGNLTLSSSPDSAGFLALDDTIAENPATFKERKNFMGQSPDALIAEKVGGDREIKKLLEVANRRAQDKQKKSKQSEEEKESKGMDPVQEYMLIGTALTQSKNGEKLSPIAVTRCFDFILQYADKIEDPQIQHTLHKNFFQQGLIQEQLRNNPAYFIDNGPLFKEICGYLQKKGKTHISSELFVREVCQRIRKQAVVECDAGLAKQISKALPAYKHDKMVGTFLQEIDTADQKLYATFALCYFSHFPPENIDGWRNLLNAFFIMKNSPFEIGHTGLQAELDHLVQKEFLPKIANDIEKDSKLCSQLLKHLTGQDGIWKKTEKPYVYAIENKSFKVDLRTGEGFSCELKYGKRDRLTKQIKEHDDFKFLFGAANPYTTCMQDPQNPDISDYLWVDEKMGAEFKLRYRKSDKSLQIFQVVKGQSWQFQKLALSTHERDKFWKLWSQSTNKTVENLVKEKGAWIAVGKDDIQDTSNILVPQHGHRLDEDPIALHISGSKIRGATLGGGKERKWVCTGLSERDAKLLNFRSGSDLLLLSKNRDQVDEIRFPRHPSTGEQLIIKRQEAGSDTWVVSGNEDWVWQLTNTKTYEERFGKEYREYLLPLKNIVTGHEEIWIFPHTAIGGGKKGAKVHFMKSITDVIDFAGGALDAAGVTGNINMGIVRNVAGMAENFAGGADGLVDGAEMLAQMGGVDPNMVDQLADLARSFTAPRGIKYRIDGRGESSSQAGFFYLAHVASLRGDWGTASRFLDLMSQNDSPTREDVSQLEKMVLTFFGTIIKEAITEKVLSKSPLESAFRAKLMASVLALSTKIKAQHGVEMFDLEKALNRLKMEPEKALQGMFGDEAKEKIKEYLGMNNTAEVFRSLVGAAFYADYRKTLTTHHRQLKELGLLLTKQEEGVLTKSPILLGLAAVGKEKKLIKEPKERAQRIQFALPTSREMADMADLIANYVKPHGVWSIEQLHKEQGSYPKGSTILANFWSYWEWILRSTPSLEIEDISFLLRELKPENLSLAEDKVRFANGVDTARRTLLAWWHYCKTGTGEDHRKGNLDGMGAILKDLKEARFQLPDLQALEAVRKEDREKLDMAPGIMNTIRAGMSELNLLYEKGLSSVTYNEDIGGKDHETGVKKVFVDLSCQLLNTFLAAALQGQAGKVITVDAIAVREPPLQPIDVNKTDKITALRERFWNEITTAVANTIFYAPIIDMLNQQKDELLPFVDALLLIPDFDAVWVDLEKMIKQLVQESTSQPGEQVQGAQKGVQKLTEFVLQGYLNNFKKQMKAVHARYLQEAGISQEPYPKVTPSAYEPVAVKPSTVDMKWGANFEDSLRVWDANRGEWKKTEKSVWDKRAERCKAKYFACDPNLSDRENHSLEMKQKGIDDAAKDLNTRTKNSFKVKSLESVYLKVCNNIKALDKKTSTLRGRLLDTASMYAAELNIAHLFADRNALTEEQIIQAVFDIYRYGQLGRLQDEVAQVKFAEQITEYILSMTELQQYGHAKEVCRSLAPLSRQLKASVPFTFDSHVEEQMVQSAANQNADWLRYSAFLQGFLEGGANRLRYNETKIVDGKEVKTEFLKDQQFSRRYLVSDIRNQWICRDKAIDALQNMLKDMKQMGEEGKPVRFIKAKMGTGKSDFIFPEAIDLLIQKEYEPVMVTTDALVDQLAVSMGGKAFVFQFSIDFGLDQAYSAELNKLSATEGRKQLDKFIAERSIEHLETLARTLENLKQEKKAILTSPSQIAALRDKRVQLQGFLEIMEPGKDRSKVFAELQLLKKIETHFKKPETIYLIDEDVNFDISFEYNFATGPFRTVDAIRFTVAEKLMRTIKDHHADLWDKIVGNNLRSLQDIPQAFRGVARSIYRDDDFWEAVGWKKDVWQKINEEEFLDFVLGIRDAHPNGLPAWKMGAEQDEKGYLCALKTFLSQTMDSVRGVNPELERGISSQNGVTVVPFDGEGEKPGVLYGEESENILHHMFHYAGAGNKIGEEIFRTKYKELGVLDQAISPLYPKEKWTQWSKKIGDVASTNYKGDHYEAFIKDPELALQRIQFLRHIMLETPSIRVYHEQITFNSQDLGLGTDVRVGSGTGQPFALNLSDYTDAHSQAPDVVLGETLLCLHLDRKTKTFDDPLERIEELAKEDKCHAILNFDYKVLGNDSEKLASRLRQENPRQMIYRVREEQQLVKKIWNSGEHFFPMTYESNAIDPNGLFLYNRQDGRGVHFHVPRGGGKYGEAMVGAGNLEDDIAQLLWRLRHIDMGHDIRMSHDKKTEDQVRKVWQDRGVDAKDITIGHCMRYFMLNTLGEEDVKNVKASIFKEQVPLKKYIDAEVRTPFDLTDIKNTECLEEIEGQAVYKALKELYILSSRSNWEKEYKARTKADPITFMIKNCKGELEKIDRMKTSFKNQILLICKKHKKAGDAAATKIKMLKTMGLITSCAKVKEEEHKRQLSNFIKDELKSIKDFSPEECAIVRQIVLKYLAVMFGFEKAQREIEAELKRLSDPDYQQYLKAHLPEQVSMDDEAGTRTEQKVQQLQEQKREQRQEKQERLLTPGNIYESIKPIQFKAFKDFALNQSSLDPYWYGTHFQSIQTIAEGERRVELPEDFKDLCISERAWKLLDRLPSHGDPVVELLVVQNGSQFSSVIITPAEREEQVAPALIEARKNEPEAAVPRKPVDPVDTALLEIRDVFMNMIKTGKLKSKTEDQVKQIFKERSTTLKTYFENCLTNGSFENGWQFFLTNYFDKVLTTLGVTITPPSSVVSGFGKLFGKTTDTKDPNASFKADLERAVRPIHKTCQHSRSKLPDPDKMEKSKARNNTNGSVGIGVYTLSKESFSMRMCMDRAHQVSVDHPEFIKTMVMNKLFLNWTEYTLDELDYLVTYVNQNKGQLADLVRILQKVRAPQSAELIETIYNADQEVVQAASQVLDKKLELNEETVFDGDLPWLLKVAQRKLAANCDKSKYRPQEITVLKIWIKLLSGYNADQAIRTLIDSGAIKSSKLLIELRTELRKEMEALDGSQPEPETFSFENYINEKAVIGMSDEDTSDDEGPILLPEPKETPPTVTVAKPTVVISNYQPQLVSGLDVATGKIRTEILNLVGNFGSKDAFAVLFDQNMDKLQDYFMTLLGNKDFEKGWNLLMQTKKGRGSSDFEEVLAILGVKDNFDSYKKGIFASAVDRYISGLKEKVRPIHAEYQKSLTI